MKKDDKNNANDMAARLQSATRNMRKPELKVGLLYKLVEQDYIDNNRKSLATVSHHINKHLRAHFPDDRSAARISTADLEEFKTKRRAMGASQSTVNSELAALRRGYVLASRKDLFDRSYMPTFNLYAIGNRNRRKGFFERGDYERFLTVLPPYLRDAARMMYICGWRAGEVRGLRWDLNYHADEHEIRIYDTKNGDTRILPLVDEDGELNDVGVVIRDRWNERVDGCPFIFHYKGKQLVKSTFYLHWRMAAKAVGSDRMPHDFRRTASRNLRNKGVDQADRMMIIGHRTPSMDLRYGIVNKEDMQRALRKVSLSNKPMLQIKPVDVQVQSEKVEVPAFIEERSDEGMLKPYFLNGNLHESDSRAIIQHDNLVEITPTCDEKQVQVKELVSEYEAVKEQAGVLKRLLSWITKERK